jgi:asparagine synthase (glutamine-hydrolysing)
MCGIAGTVDIPLTNAVLALLCHRGPDDEGITQHELAGRKINFGHRRLSIIDLSEAGHQPMTSHCGKFVIVFNGEIYNHQELRSKLSDIRFRGHSDTETIVNYLARFGIQSVADFNGIFAFALLDIAKEKLYLARDRYGVKPLYYSLNAGKFLFASEIRPIRSFVASHLNLENLATLLKLRYCPSPLTLFDNIFKLRPGHIGTLDLETMKLETSSFIAPVKLNTSISFPDAVREYGQLFENAVKRQLMSDVDVGMWLSGGVDSALVTQFAAKHYSGKLKTFTVGFTEESDANELDEAMETAKLLNTEHHEVKIGAKEFDDVLKKLVTIIEEPLGTTSTIPLYYLNELVCKHVKVVLSGQGADEPLGGYTRYQGELYREFIPGILISIIAGLGGSAFRKNEKLHRALYALGEKDVIARFEKTYALFTDDEISRLIGTNSTKSRESIRYFYDLLNGKERTPVEAMMSNDLRMNLSDDLLLYADKISMHFSVEARVPLLDNDLVDFVESLPASYRLRRGKGKLVHKAFAEQSLPERIVHRKKKGFKSPTEKWFRESVGSKYRELLSSENSKFANYFSRHEIHRLFDDHQRGINREKQIFTIVSLYYWMEEYL